MIASAVADGAITTTAIIKHFAGFYERSGGIATLRIVLLDKKGNQVPASSLNLNIVPGKQSGCAATPVAESYVVERNGKVFTILSNEAPFFKDGRRLAGL